MIGQNKVADRHEKEDKVLVLLRGALGDVLLTLPFLARLPSYFEARSLTLVGNYSILGLLADLHFIGEIMDHDRAEWAGLYRNPPEMGERLTKKIKAHKAAVVLAKRDSDPASIGLKRLGLPIVLSIPSRPPAGSRVHLTKHLLAALDLESPPNPVMIHPRSEAIKKAKEILSTFGPSSSSSFSSSPWLAIHPGSGGAKKNWPLDNWIQVAKVFSQKFGVKSLFILGPAEQGYERIIESKMKPEQAFLAQALPLPTLAALLKLSFGYIGHDSGVSHLSGVLGVKTLAIFGPTNPVCWAPNGPKVKIIAPSEKPASSDPWNWLKAGQVIKTAQKFFELEPVDVE
jgi:heptosyltransferase-2